MGSEVGTGKEIGDRRNVNVWNYKGRQDKNERTRGISPGKKVVWACDSNRRDICRKEGNRNGSTREGEEDRKA